MLTEPATKAKASAFQRLLDGDVAVLARAISLLEAGGADSEVLTNRLRNHTGSARVVAFTGPPGAGKSTLINAYVAELRRRGHRVAVLAVDPSSPLTGGAVLGDRTRMGEHSADAGVFIRSVASRGHLGGLASSIPAILDAVDAAGWQVIVLETVGAGQSETEIAEIADVNVVLNAPGLGDDVQAIKAGILEIADILVVNKCDLPHADRTVRQLQSMLQLRKAERRNIPILSTSADRAEGICELSDAISARIEDAKKVSQEQYRRRRLKGLLCRRAEAIVRNRLSSLSEADADRILEQVSQGKLSIETATEALIATVFSAVPSPHPQQVLNPKDNDPDNWDCGF
ncbi:methylmalonyl Co-A mutase-associated GTPase MeaB [Leisingera sp. S232]|uniref:methylmalonyl Co-A mutase-associated GTPase MeaB n=1 Tax=Leisingera sp. S232 TaxID=3415132 RepID=UPI003C7DBC59